MMMTIRRFLLLPGSWRWNSWVRDVTARFEKAPVCQEWQGKCGICGELPCNYHGHYPVPSGEV